MEIAKPIWHIANPAIIEHIAKSVLQIWKLCFEAVLDSWQLPGDAGPGLSWWFKICKFQSAMSFIQYAQFFPNLQYLQCDMWICKNELKSIPGSAELSIWYWRYCIFGIYSQNSPGRLLGRSWARSWVALGCSWGASGGCEGIMLVALRCFGTFWVGKWQPVTERVNNWEAKKLRNT